MAKPPKTVIPHTLPDTPSTTKPSVDPAPAYRWSVDSPSPFYSITDRPPDTSTHPLPGSDVPTPSVIVTRITDPVITDLNTYLREISWPGLQTHLLRPHESLDGMYLSPQGELYAHLEEGGYYRAELNTNGDYQIPWPAAPGVTPPILRKIEGQPRWRTEADWYTAQRKPGGSTTGNVLPAPAPTSIFLEPHLAATLSTPELSPDALRYNKLKQSFVDTAEGTVMVRKKAGEYHLASATRTDLPDIMFERIPDTTLWRVKSTESASAEQNPSAGTRRPVNDPDDSGAGPSKRPRPDESSETLDPPVRVLPTADWRTWGTSTKPQTGESIEIDGKHYSIVAQENYTHDALVFIKHPQFSADRFDEFEQLLRAIPALQPRGAIKIAGIPAGSTADKWKVVDGLPFKKTFTQYVADTFYAMADQSVNNVARAMFNRANHSETINGYGMNDLFNVFNEWTSRQKIHIDQPTNRQDLFDPLSLMPALTKDPLGFMNMPPYSADGLRRIDFDSQRIPEEWKRAMKGGSSRVVFKAVLEQQGYQIFASFRQTQRDALMFRRTGIDAIFLMLFSPFHDGRIYRGNPTDWVTSKALRYQINPADAVTLRQHLEANKIIYLLGNFNILADGQGSLVITKFD